VELDELARSDPQLWAVVDAAAGSRRDLGRYMGWVHSWEVRPHQRAWVEALQALIIRPGCWDDGCFPCRVHRQKRLLIVAPPGWGKTDTLIEFMAWVIGIDPEAAAYAFFSFNDNIATERSMPCRDTVWAAEPSEMNERYSLVFPGIKPAKEKTWGQERWFLHRKDKGRKDPTLVAAGIGGSVNARRLGGMVIDDPHNWENAATPHQRNQVKNRYNLTARTRLLADGWQVCISTRWAEDDMAGYFIELGWPTLRTPALDDNDESTWPYEKANVGYRTEDLRKLREDDPTSFLLQYQGTTVPAEGQGLIPIPILTWEPVPMKFSKVIQVWDTALAITETGSETACTTFGKAMNGKVWWLDAWSGHIGFNEQMDKVIEKHDEFERQGIAVDKVLVEQASSGGPLVDQIRANTGLGWKVRGIPVGGRGRTQGERVMSVAKYFEVIYMSAGAHWKGKAISQLMSYGTPGVKDDILMSAVHALHEMFPPVMKVLPLRVSLPAGWR